MVATWYLSKYLTNKVAKVNPQHILNITPSTCAILIADTIDFSVSSPERGAKRLLQWKRWCSVRELAPQLHYFMSYACQKFIMTRRRRKKKEDKRFFSRLPRTRRYVWRYYSDGLCCVSLSVALVAVWQAFNSLPTNDGKCRHDLCELSISLWEFIWGF